MTKRPFSRLSRFYTILIIFLFVSQICLQTNLKADHDSIQIPGIDLENNCANPELSDRFQGELSPESKTEATAFCITCAEKDALAGSKADGSNTGDLKRLSAELMDRERIKKDLEFWRVYSSYHGLKNLEQRILDTKHDIKSYEEDIINAERSQKKYKEFIDYLSLPKDKDRIFPLSGDQYREFVNRVRSDFEQRLYWSENNRKKQISQPKHKKLEVQSQAISLLQVGFSLGH